MFRTNRFKILCFLLVFLIISLLFYPACPIVSKALAGEILTPQEESLLPETNGQADDTVNGSDPVIEKVVLPDEKQHVESDTTVDEPDLSDDEFFKTHATGWVPSDPEVLKLHTQSATQRVTNTVALPTQIDWSSEMPIPGNQGSQESCVAWATAYASKTFLEQHQHKWGANITKHQFSPAYVFNQLNGGLNSGITIADALTLMCQQGCDTLGNFPYNSNNYTSQPTSTQRLRASIFKNSNWMFLTGTGNWKYGLADIALIKQALTRGPVVVATYCSNTKGWNSGDLNYCDMVKSGGHAVCIVGYDDNHVMDDGSGAFKFMNSWGSTWGHNGYGWMSYSYCQQGIIEAMTVYDSYDDSFPVSGEVLKDSQKLSNVNLSFRLVSGSGAAPFSVISDENGQWDQTGFSVDGTYRITPNKSGYTFSPAYIDLSFDNKEQINFAFCASQGETNLQLISPGKDQVWGLGSHQTITWEYSGDQCTFQLDLKHNGTVVKTLSSDLGVGSDGKGSYSWEISNGLAGGNYTLNLTSNTDPALNATSEEFIISPIIIISPLNGEICDAGTEKTITWSFTGMSGLYRINLMKMGSYVKNIAEGLTGEEGSYIWRIPDDIELGADYQLQFSCADFSILSDYFLIIKPLSTLTVTNPAGPAFWTNGSKPTIRWSLTGNPGPIRIELLKGGNYLATINPNIASGAKRYELAASVNQEPGSDYQVRLTSNIDSTVSTTSDYFCIAKHQNIDCSTISFDKEYYFPGDKVIIKYTYSGTPTKLSIDLAEDYVFDKVFYIHIGDIQASNGSGQVLWTIPTDIPDKNWIICATGSDPNDIVCNYRGILIYHACIDYPSKGDILVKGRTSTIRWTPKGAAFNCKLVLKNSEKIIIADSVSSDQGFYDWIVPKSLESGTNYKLAIIDSTGRKWDYISDYFTIQDQPSGRIVINYMAKTSCKVGENQKIGWAYNGSPGVLKVELLKGGKVVSTLSSSYAATNNFYNWIVGADTKPGTDYQVRMTSMHDVTCTSVSDYFTIIGNLKLNSIEPAANATKIPVDQNIILSFDQDLMATTDYNSITLKQSGSLPVSINKSIDGNVLTISPSTRFAFGKAYTLTIPEDAVVGMSGDRIPKDYICKFTTIQNNLKVQTADPLAGAAKVDLNKAISLTFTEDIAAGTAYNTITLKNAAKTSVGIDKSINGKVLTITPTNSLSYNTRYTLNLPIGAVQGAVFNNPLPAACNLIFTTKTLAVSSSDPIANAAKVPVNQVITLNFGEEISAGTAYEKIVLKDASNTVVPISKSIAGNALIITPSTNLAFSKSYTLTIPAAAVNGSGAQPLPAAFTAKFTTQANTLKVKTADPLANATKVELDKAINLTFTEEVKAGTAYDSITLKNAAKANIGIEKSISGNNLTITPTVDLAYNTRYTLNLPIGAVQGIALGNPLPTAYNISFTTKTLAIGSIDPAANATKVSVNPTITLDFSEEISAGAAYETIVLKDASNVTVPINKDISGCVLTITPTSQLGFGKAYTLTIPKAAVDGPGGSLPAAYTSKFTTQTNTLKVQTADPAANAAKVPVNKAITITFSEEINEGTAYGSIALKDAARAIVDTDTIISGKTLTITPAEDLAPSTKYTLTLPVGAVQGTTLGNPLPKAYSLVFTTITS